VLKLGHHGAAGSTGEKFLQTVNPQAAVAPIPDWLAIDKRGLRVTNLLKAKNIPYFKSCDYPLLSIVSNGYEFEMLNIIYPK
jgi:beta-lactamase superfamily II metal-dependent hydrolase